ncbi:MAG: C40 family peptidase [Clostridia bacterium]|nr:C40 family peptidase [Clostridia bacterium]
MCLYGCNNVSPEQLSSDYVTEIPDENDATNNLIENNESDAQNSEPQGNEPIINPEPEISYDHTKKYAVSNTNGLRIRSAPTTSSAVIGSLDEGDVVIYTGKTDGFIKTVYKEQTAYVSEKYCETLEIDVTADKIEAAIDFGCTLLGYPYVWGSQRFLWANGVLNRAFKTGEFDCSAFVQYIFYVSTGIVLDVTTRTQVNYGVPVLKENIKRGDLLFFTNSSRKNNVGIERIGHVGIYFGNNYILHTASDHAVIEPISDLRWSYFITAKRLIF